MKTAQLSVLKRLDNLVAGARSRAAAAIVGANNRSGTNAGGVVPSDLTSTATPTIVLAMDLTRSGSGLFMVTIIANYALAGADNVSWDVLVVPNVTAFSGGTLVGPNLRYESGTPLVVTGDSPVLQFGDVQAIATGNIAHCCASFGGLAQLPSGRSAIILNAVAPGGQHITGINVQASAYELP